MGINVDVATLSQRLRDFSKSSIEMAMAAKRSSPAQLAAEEEAYYNLTVMGTSLLTEFALATKGMAPQQTEGLQSAVRAVTLLKGDANNVALSNVGRINNTYLAAVAGGPDMPTSAAKQALEAAQWLDDNPPALLQFGTELVKTGSKGGEILDVSAVTGQIFGALARGAQDSVVVSGRSGAGRSIIIQDLAEKLSKGLAPANVRDARVIGLDVGRFRADSSDPVVLAKRLKETLDSAYDFDQEAVVVFDDFDMLQDSIDAALITRNAIQDSKGKLRVVAFTSDTKAPFVLDDKRLSSFAQHVTLPNTTLDRARDILTTKWDDIERATGVAPADEVVTKAITALAERYLAGRNRDLAGLSVDVARGAAGRVAAEMFSTPKPVLDAQARVASLTKDVNKYTGKTSDIAKERLAKATDDLKVATEELADLKQQWDAELPAVRTLDDANRVISKLRTAGAKEGDEALTTAIKDRDAAIAALETVRDGKPGVIADKLDVDAVIRYVSEESKVPVESISWDASEKFEGMYETMRKQLVGQDHILRALTAPTQTWKAGGKDPDRAPFIIALGGPSQVGKTEGAFVYAEFLSGSRESLDTVVGGAYTDPSMRNSLVGAPSGYRDSEIGGALTTPARERPHGVTLWDEANKSHPDLFDTLLQIGNTGEIADGMGRMVSFRERGIIVAGNWLRNEADEARLHWDKISPKEQGEWKARLRTKMEEQGIKPEVLNRFTDFVVANSVHEEMVRGVADIYMKKVGDSFARMDIELIVKPEVLDHLATQANVPGQGGSLIKKVITAEIKDVILAQKIGGQIGADDIVTVSMKNIDGEPKISLDVTKL